MTALPRLPDLSLPTAARAFAVAFVLAQLAFAAHVANAYVLPALTAGLQALAYRNAAFHSPGDTIGNLMVATHMFAGFAALVLGPVQLLPAVRRRTPALHRWAGRGFMAAALMAVLAGLYMIFVRDIGGWSLKLGFVLQALVMTIFGVAALNAIFARDIARHRAHALRFLMVASIALTYRIILVIWFLATGGVGVDPETASGPVLDAMVIGQFIPLAWTELYLRAQREGTRAARRRVAASLWLAALLVVSGTGLLAVGEWFAHA